MSLGARELFLDSRGSIVRISRIVVILRVAPARKSTSILRQIGTNFQFVAVLFFAVFSNVRFFDFLLFRVPGGSIWALILKLF